MHAMRAGDGAGARPATPAAAAAARGALAARTSAAPPHCLACPPRCRSYEGLMMNDVPHNKGVLVLGNGLGGGIQKADRGDKCVEGGPALLLHGCLQLGMLEAGSMHGYASHQAWLQRKAAANYGTAARQQGGGGGSSGRAVCGWHVQRGTWQPHAQLIRMANRSHAPQLPCRSSASTVSNLCCSLPAAPAALHSC